MATLDALRPRLARLPKLSQRGDDTRMAVGSDLMTNELEGYAVLKVTGKGQGVDDLRKMLAARFARSSRTPAVLAAPAEPVAVGSSAAPGSMLQVEPASRGFFSSA